jgi:hypothetical protein
MDETGTSAAAIEGPIATRKNKNNTNIFFALHTSLFARSRSDLHIPTVLLTHFYLKKM